MNYLIPAPKASELKVLVAEAIVSHLIKGFVLTGGCIYRCNVFYDLKINETEDLCLKSIKIAEDLGYSLSFSHHRGNTYAHFKIQEEENIA